jgi:DNA repair exonuclease SbcCD ATPase subunit
MTDFARVDSLDALKALRVALCKFADTLRTGLDEAQAEVRQAAIWLDEQQSPSWKREVTNLTERVNTARLELTRKEYTKQLLDSAMSLVEERKLLAQLRDRLETAQTKVASCQRWQRRLEQETFSFKGGIQGLSQAIHQDVPAALALLDNMIMALEAYAAVRPAGDSLITPLRPDEPAGAPEGMAGQS